MTHNTETDRAGSNTYKILTRSVEDTIQLGHRISGFLGKGDIIAMLGDYGTGKTYLSKGIVYGLGVPETEYVTSPAFDLIHEFQGRLCVYHMDFYRLDRLNEDDYSWLDEYFYGEGVCIIEWAEKFVDNITNLYLKIELFYTKLENEREIHLSAIGKRYTKIIQGMLAK